MPGGLELLSPGACVVQTVDVGDECHVWDVTCNRENWSCLYRNFNYISFFRINGAIFL